MNTPNQKEYTDTVMRNNFKEEQLPKVQFFSKWRKVWVDFKVPPNIGHIIELENKHYHLRVNQ